METATDKRRYYTAGLREVTVSVECWNEEEDGEIDLTVSAWYRPARPTPACSNPSDSAFSDSGDPDEWEIVSIKDKANGGDIARHLWPEGDSFDEALSEALSEDYEEQRRGWED